MAKNAFGDDIVEQAAPAAGAAPAKNVFGDEVVQGEGAAPNQPSLESHPLLSGDAGFQRGIAALFGLPGDTLENVLDLGRAGIGSVATATGHPEYAPNIPDRENVWLTGENIAKHLRGAGVAVDPQGQTSADRYAYVAGMGLAPTLVAQPEVAPSMAARGVAGSVAGQLAADVTGNPLAAIPANLLVSGAPGPKALAGHLGATYPASKTDVATQTVLGRIASDQKAGGISAEDAIEAVNSARAAGQPLALVDVLGKNAQGLAGRVARRPGDSKAIVAQLEKRDEAAPQRVSDQIDKAFPAGSSYEAVQSLQKARSAQSRPLYEEAMKPGSTAPLEHQFGAALDEALDGKNAAVTELNDAETKAAAAAANQANVVSRVRAGGDVSLFTDAEKQVKAAEEAVEQARQRVDVANQYHQKILGHLQDAQDAVKQGIRGGVWSPRLQEFLDNPRVQQGIQKGLVIERDNALAEGRPFNAKDYAVVGEKDGNPVVAKVPNMKLLQMGKEGLDAMVESYRNPVTGKLDLDKEGRAIDAVRRTYVDELDRLNPSYKTARQSWAGPSQSMDAVKFGEKALSMKPRDLEARVSGMSQSDREFAKLGIAETLRNAVLKTGRAGDETRKITGTPWVRSQIRPFFDNDADFNRFINAMENEHKMLTSTNKVWGGSISAERVGEDVAGHAENAVRAGKALMSAAHGNVLASAIEFMRLKKAMGMMNDPELNASIAKLLTGHGLEPMQPLSVQTAPPKPLDAAGTATRAALAPAEAQQ